MSLPTDPPASRQVASQDDPPEAAWAEPGVAESAFAEPGVAEAAFACPTCGASQTPLATCRRCGCDLALVVALRRENQRLRQLCLAYLRQRRLLPATRLALRCCRLSLDDHNLSLLATCYLLRGDFNAAVGLLAGRRAGGSVR